MAPTLWLLGWVLATAQMPGPVPPSSPPPVAVSATDWVLAPRLGRSQELVYRGTFQEKATGPGVEFDRSYRIESRLFVLDTPTRGYDVAVLTTLHALAPREPITKAGACSVRLERLAVDLQGKVVPEPGVRVRVPLDGVPTLECGFFVAVPGGRLRSSQTWEEVDPGKPARIWSVQGTEMINATMTLKVAGVQQSDDWDRPRADRIAWRRIDTVWLVPRTGMACRVERVIEKREPAHRLPTMRSVLRYDQESTLQYPGPLSEDRRQEITQALTLRSSASPLLPTAQRNEKALATLVRKIEYHTEHIPPTPYREAVLQVKRQIEAARRGELPAAAGSEAEEVPSGTQRTGTAAAVGEPAPDFAASQITSTEIARLSQWKGKPILLVFYNPASHTAPDLLRFCQSLHASYGKHMAVVGLSASDDARVVLAQWNELKCTFPVLNGGGLRTAYVVESTPKIVLIDAAGIVRGDYLGWGKETPNEVLEELRKWWPK